MTKKVLILGGAGFIGSHLVDVYLENGHSVTAIDPVLPECSGRIDHLDLANKNLHFISTSLEQIENASQLISESDLIIDSMGLTSHHIGMENPELDLGINLLPQIRLIKELIKYPGKQVIYLGSRTQFGAVSAEDSIDEDYPQVPLDVQGIHKVAAESYYRIYSTRNKLNVLSLRLVNIFGERQRVTGSDLGLMGTYITNALQGKELDVYSKTTQRQFMYVRDLAQVVYELSQKHLQGFNAVNIPGKSLKIYDLASLVIESCQSGKIRLPVQQASFEVGTIELSGNKLKSLIGELKLSDENVALKKSITYFKEQLEL